MMSKTLTTAALVVGMMSVGASAAPKKTGDTTARAMTRQLNEQQLAAAGSTMQPAQQPLGPQAQPPQPPATPEPMAEPMQPQAPPMNDAATPGMPRPPQ